jgi:hypothetical protein
LGKILVGATTRYWLNTFFEIHRIYDCSICVPDGQQGSRFRPHILCLALLLQGTGKPERTCNKVAEIFLRVLVLDPGIPETRTFRQVSLSGTGMMLTPGFLPTRGAGMI